MTINAKTKVTLSNIFYMMSGLQKLPYAEFEGEKKPVNTLPIWKSLILILTMIAFIAVAAVFTWHALRHETDETGKHFPETSTRNAESLPCPQFPTLFPLPKPTPKRITEVFQELKAAFSSAVDKKSLLPAISVNVFYQDVILWSGHFGSRKYQQPKLKPNGRTVYRIGSVTKVFAVLLMYKLYEEGKIASIDDPLSKYAPDFAIKNPYTGENITLREIASQMSGLPREAPCFYSCINTTTAEQLELLKNRTLVWPPWNTPSYSNLGYALLGRLLTENLLKQTFESWTIANIIKPLGMVNTGFEITEEVQKNMAFPYEAKGKKVPFMKIGWLAPAGQMYSTIDDLAKLGMMFAQPDKQKLFKPATLREMMTPKDITPDGVTVWGSPFEMVFRGHVLIRTKGGSIDTYHALFVVIPELALGANLLISTVDYGNMTAEGVALGLLSNQLVKTVIETLFEIQGSSHFPIDPTPYIGKFKINQTSPISGRSVSYIVTIKEVENILRFDYPEGTNMWQEIRYIGESLVFQSRYRFPRMSCLSERAGTLGAIYYDPLGKDNLSPGFQIPERLIVATRLTKTNESFLKASGNDVDKLIINLFKNAL